MDIQIIQKYKEGGNGEYVLVYSSEGKDDPFGDILVQDAQELSSEIEINLPGEVTMATTVDEKLEKILDSYGGGETISVAAYVKTSEFYGSEAKEEAKIEEDEEEKEESKTAND